MTKTNLTFKIISLILLVVDVVFAIFFLTSTIMALAKVAVLGNIHFILLIIIVALNLIYFAYTMITLQLHKK